MATLHVVSHSPHGDTRLESCLALIGHDDALLLCGDAVYGLQDGTQASRAIASRPAGVALYALQEDVLARGLEGQRLAEAVDYKGFVGLSCRYARVNTWL